MKRQAAASSTPSPTSLTHQPWSLRCTPIRNGNRTVALLVASLLSAAAITALGPTLASCGRYCDVQGRPDLRSVRAKIKAKDFQAALAELRTVADTHQHADVYSLMGFSLRKTGDYATALTFYKKALDFDANHKGAREYLGELYVETGELPKRANSLPCFRSCVRKAAKSARISSRPSRQQHQRRTDARS